MKLGRRKILVRVVEEKIIKLLLMVVLFCVLGCTKEDNGRISQKEKISSDIQALIAGKVISTLYLTTIGFYSIQFEYPAIFFDPNFLIIDGTNYVDYDKISSYVLGQTGTEYYLDIVALAE
ncbi:MAG: hypothetical protein M0Q38_00155 [Bacteroidales bacterium]|jgi:hypothetical protein|nr:hypothetical protein [Bacteroidales bacterium]